MIPGIVWALIGLAACEVTGRGKVTTTVVTAAAGALGVGARAAHGASVPVVLVAGVGLVALALVAFLVITLTGARGPRRHGSAAIASTRQVLYHETKAQPRHHGKARPDRTRGGAS